MGVARAMVRGCDVWLNTPRRPLEASGTSGMKAAVNGVLNLSRPGRLVGRGVRARRRLGDRRHLGRGRSRAALSAARGAGRTDLHREPRPLGRDDEGVDRRPRAALLDAARGDRVRRSATTCRAPARPALVAAQAPRRSAARGRQGLRLLARRALPRSKRRARPCAGARSSGVTSTHSSSRMNSSACSSDSGRGGIRRTSSSAVDERMFVSFFSLVALTSRSSARAFSPTIMPS